MAQAERKAEIVIHSFEEEKCDLCHRNDRCIGFGYNSEKAVLKLCWPCLCYLRGKMIALSKIKQVPHMYVESSVIERVAQKQNR
jgi:hypothetical protein